MPYGRSSAATFTALGHREHANYPDGSLRSSVLDLSRFLIMSMQFGEFQGTRILAKSTVEEMFRSQIPTLDDVQGLAWYKYDTGSRGLIGHDGEDPGANALMFIDPSDNAGVLLAANGQWDAERAQELFEKLFAESSTF
jgi:hypothetical protein